jgi:uncharacterized protein (TIGR02284 family)
MQNTATHSILEELLATVDDGKRGFAEAADKLEADGHPALAADMRDLSQQRLRMSNELKALAASGGAPIEDGNGTIAGAVHRSVMALRNTLTGDDPYSVLAAAEQGEDHAVAEFEKALREELPPEIKAVLQRQHEEVLTAHERVRALRDNSR